MTIQQFFSKCTTLEALKSERNRLAKLYHPDRGGDTARMQEINAQFDQAKNRLSAPEPQRVYSGPKPPHSADNFYEQMQQWARQREQERLQKERQKHRDDIAKQKAKLRAEIEWAWERLYTFRRMGGLAACTFKGNSARDWLRVDGNTYPYREWLKANGFRWEPAARNWYFYKKPFFNPDEEELLYADYDEPGPDDIPF